MTTSNRYPNSNKLWSKTDEESLTILAKANTDIYAVCDELGRSPMAVILKLRQLSGLEIPYPKEMIPPEFSDETLTTREKYTEHGTRWSRVDNERLLKDFYNGKTVIELAKVLNRHPHAVIVQISKLNQKRAEITALYNRAKELLGKKRVVKIQPIPSIIMLVGGILLTENLLKKRDNAYGQSWNRKQSTSRGVSFPRNRSSWQDEYNKGQKAGREDALFNDSYKHYHSKGKHSDAYKAGFQAGHDEEDW